MLIGACNPILCPIHVFRHTPRVCPWCHRHFTSDPWFEKHKLGHAGQPIAAEPHACTACNTTFATLELLHHHKQSDEHKYRHGNLDVILYYGPFFFTRVSCSRAPRPSALTMHATSHAVGCTHSD